MNTLNAGSENGTNTYQVVALPKVQKAIQAGRKAQSLYQKPLKLKQLLATKEMKEAVGDLIETSSLNRIQKKYLKYLLVDNLSKTKAFQKATGLEEGFDTFVLGEEIVKQEDIKNFLDLIRQIYVQIVPLAVVKEVDLLLSPKTSDDVKLRAAQDIQNRAGISEDTTSNLPVKLIINAPQGGDQAVQINIGDKNE